jgi:penicillin-binding protein 1A
MGLARSRNLVSIRILDAIGIETVIDYATRFGFDPKTMPHGLSLALGTLDTTPLEMAAAFSVFANGGYKVMPHVFDYLTDDKGTVLMRNQVTMACSSCDTPAPQVITSANAYIMTDILKDVIKRGTGRGALVLEREDLAGKTGSTNDHRDAWFVGYNHDLVASVWFGYERNRTLGKGEYAAQTALPVWIDFMRVALDHKPESTLAQPADVAYVRVSPTEFELFTTDTAPSQNNAPAANEKWVEPANLF